MGREWECQRRGGVLETDGREHDMFEKLYENDKDGMRIPSHHSGESMGQFRKACVTLLVLNSEAQELQ